MKTAFPYLVPLLFIGLVVSVFSGVSSAGRYAFTGNESCEKCHKQIYESWEKSVHAKAFENLKPGVRAKKKTEVGLKPATDFTQDKSCMNCHTLGWDKGGYSMESPDERWQGIGCEHCHGAAEKYLMMHADPKLAKRDRKLKQAGLIKPFKGKSVCEKCHTHRDSPFKEREEGRDRDWTDPKLADTYHVLN